MWHGVAYQAGVGRLAAARGVAGGREMKTRAAFVKCLRRTGGQRPHECGVKSQSNLTSGEMAFKIGGGERKIRRAR